MADTTQPTTKEVKTKYNLYVSSFHCKNEYSNAVGVVEKQVTEYTDGTREQHDILRWYKDPQRPFWVTKPEYRTTSYKKEFEKLSNCDMYMARDSELESKVAAALGYPPYRRYVNLKQLCQSVYLYGADIPTETLIKQAYVHKAPAGKVAEFTRGALDIESEVRGEKRINVITFIHEHHIFTCALKEYCRIFDGKINGEDTFHPATEEDCLKTINDMLGPYLRDHKFELHFKIAPDELSMITWIFQQIHACKTNFIGIWNMGFDLPMILNRLTKLGVDPASVMCHPDVPREYRICDWYEDKSQVQHFTDKWHWMTLAGYSQFIDSMCLYARLRKVYGRDSSYSLDDISTKELGQGKIHFGDITNHWYEQTYHFLPYIAYNINDVMIMQLMEWKNNDMTALTGLSGMSLMSQFSRQTIMLRNDAYDFAKSKGMIPSATGMNMFTEYDKMMLKAGGTVLPPNKAEGIGIRCVEELPNRPTQVSIMTNDLDVSSFYPSVVSFTNVSKETALATIINVNGHSKTENEILCGGLVQPNIAAMELGEQFYALPGYKEMEQLFMTEMQQRHKEKA